MFKYILIFTIQLLINSIICYNNDYSKADFCTKFEPNLSPSEATIDTKLKCLPGSKIGDIEKLAIKIKNPPCTGQVVALFSRTYNITLRDGCKTTLVINDQPMKAVFLNGNKIEIVHGNLTINNISAQFYYKNIAINNNENICCTKEGLTHRESIFAYFGVFGKTFGSSCLGSVKFHYKPGLH